MYTKLKWQGKRFGVVEPFGVKGAMWLATRVTEPSLRCGVRGFLGDANVGMVFLASLFNVNIHIYVQVCKPLELVT